jgi:hypothetical protein
MVGADAQKHPARRQYVESCRVRRYLNGLAHASPRDAGAQSQAGRHRRCSAEWRGPRARMVALDSLLKPNASRRRARASQDGRSDGSACTLTAMSGMRRNLPVAGARAPVVRRPANRNRVGASLMTSSVVGKYRQSPAVASDRTAQPEAVVAIRARSQ